MVDGCIGSALFTGYYNRDCSTYVEERDILKYNKVFGVSNGCEDWFKHETSSFKALWNTGVWNWQGAWTHCWTFYIRVMFCWLNILQGISIWIGSNFRLLANFKLARGLLIKSVLVSYLNLCVNVFILKEKSFDARDFKAFRYKAFCLVHCDDEHMPVNQWIFRFLAHDDVCTGSFCIIYALVSVVCCLVLLTCSLLRSLSNLPISFTTQSLSQYLFPEKDLIRSSKNIERETILWNTFRSCPLFDRLASVLFLIITVSNICHSSKVYRNQRFAIVIRALNILDILKSLKEEDFEYEHLYTPLSDAISLQWTYRDHKIIFFLF